MMTIVYYYSCGIVFHDLIIIVLVGNGNVLQLIFVCLQVGYSSPTQLGIMNDLGLSLSEVGLHSPLFITL